MNRKKYDILQKIGEKYNTDKSRIGYKNNTYLNVYDRYFNENREDVKKFVEIGVLDGNSLKMWRDYFPNATIYGVDIDPRCKSYEDDRIEIVIGDQNDDSFLNKFKNDIKEIDILIDDGSHITKHQIKTFNILNEIISDGGFYVIEDLLNSYEERWKYWDIDNEKLREIWPGMKYNSSEKMMNYRYEFDDFINSIITNMDYQKEDSRIIGVNLHSMQLVMEFA
jgi:hypothetical protein